MRLFLQCDVQPKREGIVNTFPILIDTAEVNDSVARVLERGVDPENAVRLAKDRNFHLNPEDLPTFLGDEMMAIIMRDAIVDAIEQLDYQADFTIISAEMAGLNS